MTTEPTEQFSNSELDQLSGALLFTGGIHAALGGLLDATSDPESLELIEFINHLPAEVAGELIASTMLALHEVSARIQALIRATGAAFDSMVERIDTAKVDEAFDNVMHAEFGDEAKLNGLA